MKDILKRIFKVTFMTFFWILSPIATGLYFIWPGRDKMSKGWKIFWWILYAVIAIVIFLLKAYFCLLLLMYDGVDNGTNLYIYTSVQPATYRTSEDFYKLTGVEFPELEIVDSLLYVEDFFPDNCWYEYKFVAKGGLSKSFKKRLERACKTDSTHWSYSEGSLSDWNYKDTGEPIVGDRKIYKYCIYPDKEPVDRSRGMCDRMVESYDGSIVEDRYGSFISVEIKGDTIVLLNGWVR